MEQYSDSLSDDEQQARRATRAKLSLEIQQAALENQAEFGRKLAEHMQRLEAISERPKAEGDRTNGLFERYLRSRQSADQSATAASTTS